MIHESRKSRPESPHRRSRSHRPGLRGTLEALSAVLLAASLLALGTSPARADTPGTAPEPTSPGILAFDYYEFRAEHSNKCLDVANASIAHATPVVQGDCWGGTNQHWRWAATGNGYYKIHVQHSGKCLDVAHASVAHGAPVVQGDCWSGNNQRWRLYYAGTWS